MLRRFSLYGFLKNQQYYEPFMVLAFLQMGLSFTLIGVLVAIRELSVNLMEIPSGAIADLCGRRKSMILSFVSYIISFAVYGLAGLARLEYQIALPLLMGSLIVATLFFAVGEAFRTGTHKAMIFTWLKLEGRIDEKVKVYGFTRSWSKIGSAVSVIIACGIVFATSNFIFVFFFAAIPYLLNIVNFLGYPSTLDGDTRTGTSLKDVIHHLREALGISWRRHDLRRLIFESMGFEGFFKAAKDYLQPILKMAALPLSAGLFAGVAMSEEQKSVLLIGPVFFLLFLLSALASRKAHLVVDKQGCEEKTARMLWGVTALVIAVVILPATWFGYHAAIIIGFIILYGLQNIWRPVLISRFDAHSEEHQGATILSIESQAKSISTMLLAPLIGLAVDYCHSNRLGATEFWPVAVVGVVITVGFLISGKRVKDNPSPIAEQTRES